MTKCRPHDMEGCPACMQERIDELVQFAEFIRDGYARGDINHVDYRVGAYKAALDVLAAVGQVPK